MHKRLVLYGGVHKMSTLVQWASVELIDVEANKLLDDRSLTFRGDFGRRLAPRRSLRPRENEGSRFWPMSRMAR